MVVSMTDMSFLKLAKKYGSCFLNLVRLSSIILTVPRYTEQFSDSLWLVILIKYLVQLRIRSRIVERNPSMWTRIESMTNKSFLRLARKFRLSLQSLVYYYLFIFSLPIIVLLSWLDLFIISLYFQSNANFNRFLGWLHEMRKCLSKF